MKKTMYEPIPVSSGGLPNKTGRYGVIIEGSDCIDSSLFTKTDEQWRQIGTAKVTHWLKETIIDIPDDIEKIISDVINDYDSLVRFASNIEPEHCILPFHYEELSKDIAKKVLAAIYPNESVVGVKFKDRVQIPWEDNMK